MEQELIGSAVIAWMVAKGIEIAKGLSWLPLDATTERLNWWAARGLAAATAVGIHFTFDPQAGSLVITGLTLAGIGHAVLEYAKQLFLQEVAYKKFIREERERS